MATKSSKIAVTLQPSLKHKLREYGKENQIKNFSGVILAILDEYFGGAPAATPAESEPPSDVWAAIKALTDRLNALEGGTATTAATAEKNKEDSKPQKASTRRTGTQTRAKSTATKTKTKRTTGKTTTTAKPTPKKTSSTKTSSTKATKSTASKAKSTRSVKSSSKAAPAKKAKTTRRTTPGRKPTKTKSTVEWMSTREAFNIYGGNLSWSRFSKLTPEELKERFNLDSDLSRKVRGSRFNQWLKPGK